MKRFLHQHLIGITALLVTGSIVTSILTSIWFMWFFAWRDLVGRLETIGVEGLILLWPR